MAPVHHRSPGTSPVSNWPTSQEFLEAQNASGIVSTSIPADDSEARERCPSVSPARQPGRLLILLAAYGVGLADQAIGAISAAPSPYWQISIHVCRRAY
jgi:hypothetical protein